MKIESVIEENFESALAVYTASWKESHEGICSEDFLQHRDYRGYLRKKLGTLFLLTDDVPVGIICCAEGELGDLYVLPDRQGQGYGTALLRFALDLGAVTLTVLSTNAAAIRLYEHIGFRFTGRKTFLREGLWELEMKYLETKYG